MAEKRSIKYHQLQWYLTFALVAAAGMFALYLVFAGFGIVWLKAVTAILAILISFGCLAILFMKKELLRQRSLWMTAAAVSIIVCLLFSLILRFPSPNKYKNVEPATSDSSTVMYWDGRNI